MIRLVALIISITLQIVAAVLAIRLVRVTKYRASWIFISVGFILMAIKMIIKLMQFLNDDFSFYLRPADDWLGVVIAFLFTAGVFLIGEMFYTLSRAERERKRSERRLVRAIIQTEERERRRFAKDLHDGLGPLLSTARMTMSALLQYERDDHSRQILYYLDAKISIFYLNGMIDSAKYYVRESEKIDTANYGFLCDYALVFAEEEPEKSLRYSLKASEINPWNDGAKIARIKSYLWLNRLQDAIDFYQNSAFIGNGSRFLVTEDFFHYYHRHGMSASP